MNKLTELHATLKLLRKAYERTGMAESDTIEMTATMSSLRLTEAFLEKNIAVSQQTRHIPQIAVLGPTQAGKSTVVNLLLGARHAQTSPLAGFTVHPQAFALNPDTSDLETLDGYFHDFKRCAIRDLAPGSDNINYAKFGWEQVSVAPDHPLSGTVVWDTPDFDSVDAVHYRHGLVRTIAFADIVLIVLSKEKYADQSVWEMIELLAPLKQPTLLCLNKVDADSEATLTHALQEKWSQHRRDAYSALIVLSYRKPPLGEEPQLASAELLQTVQTLAARKTTIDAAEPAVALIARHWTTWIAPIKGERLALNRWQALIEDRVAEALEIYQRDYLDHPRHYNSFQRALAELLTLLEIPGFARGIALTRQVLTWPFRQLTQLAHIGKHSALADDAREITLLGQTFDHLLIRVSEAALDAAEDNSAPYNNWWRELVQKLRVERAEASARFLNAATAYHQAFKPEIEHTAQLLHTQLSRHPAVLNSLRATRAFADTTALALALHTGGIGVQDFIIAPATITITSLLTESALGRYLGRAQAELKARQLSQVNTLFQTQADRFLSTLPSRLDPERRFNIPVERLESVEKLLKHHER